MIHQSIGFKFGEFRGHKLGNMKSGVCAHCTQQLDWLPFYGTWCILHVMSLIWMQQLFLAGKCTQCTYYSHVMCQYCICICTICQHLTCTINVYCHSVIAAVNSTLSLAACEAKNRLQSRGAGVQVAPPPRPAVPIRRLPTRHGRRTSAPPISWCPHMHSPPNTVKARR